jgi:hypothetical protein
MRPPCSDDHAILACVDNDEGRTRDNYEYFANHAACVAQCDTLRSDAFPDVNDVSMRKCLLFTSTAHGNVYEVCASEDAHKRFIDIDPAMVARIPLNAVVRAVGTWHRDGRRHLALDTKPNGSVTYRDGGMTGNDGSTRYPILLTRNESHAFGPLGTLGGNVELTCIQSLYGPVHLGITGAV